MYRVTTSNLGPDAQRIDAGEKSGDRGDLDAPELVGPPGCVSGNRPGRKRRTRPAYRRHRARGQGDHLHEPRKAPGLRCQGPRGPGDRNDRGGNYRTPRPDRVHVALQERRRTAGTDGAPPRNRLRHAPGRFGPERLHPLFRFLRRKRKQEGAGESSERCR